MPTKNQLALIDFVNKPRFYTKKDYKELRELLLKCEPQDLDNFYFNSFLGIRNRPYSSDLDGSILELCVDRVRRRLSLLKS